MTRKPRRGRDAALDRLLDRLEDKLFAQVAVVDLELDDDDGSRVCRREPEDTTLYGVVRDPLPTLLERARDHSEHGFGYPRFVEREFEKLSCGLRWRDFVRVRCDRCDDERLVAFSCKTRG